MGNSASQTGKIGNTLQPELLFTEITDNNAMVEYKKLFYEVSGFL